MFTNIPNYKNDYTYWFKGGDNETMWVKPPGIKFILIIAVGAGGGGGKGFISGTPTISSSNTGGGGGGSGQHVRGLFPAFAMPDALVIKAGNGGNGSTVNGSRFNGGDSFVAPYTRDTTIRPYNSYVYAYGGEGGDQTGGNIVANSTPNANAHQISDDWSTQQGGLFMIGVSQKTLAKPGATGTTAAGGVVTFGSGGTGVSNTMVTGGSAGGGNLGAANSLGGTQAGNFIITATTGTRSATAGAAGANGITLWKPFFSIGGDGGNSNSLAAATGGKGGDGGYGSGGGGGGAGGTAGGNGGRGGDGFVLIQCF